MIIFLTLILTLTLNIDNTSEFLKSLSRVAWRSGGGANCADAGMPGSSTDRTIDGDATKGYIRRTDNQRRGRRHRPSAA